MNDLKHARGVLWFLACLCLLPLWLAARDKVAKPDGADALSSVKQAMGGARWDNIRTLHARGRFEMGELQGTFEEWLDVGSQRSYTDLRYSHPAIGDLRSTSGWNGSVSWSADQTGDVCVTASAVARRRAARDAYREAFAYLLKNTRPVSVTVRADATIKGQRFHVLLITPPEDSPFELWTDRATSRIARMVPLTGLDRTVTSYADLRMLEGLFLPFRVEQHEGRSGEFSTVLTTNSIEIDREPPEHIFDPPSAVLAGLQFPAGVDSVSLPFQFDGGHIYLPVKINGQRLDNFVFDTGADNTIEVSRAKSLGLKVIKADAAAGGGTELVPNGRTRIQRMEIGDLTMQDQIIDVTPLPVLKPRLDGIAGYELAKRSVVTIDYSLHRITFTKPESFRAPEGAKRLPLRFASISEIVVDGKLDGIDDEFQLDTGMDSSLDINRPFAERSGLLRAHHKGPKGSVAGVGGKAGAVLFMPSEFTLGGLKPSISAASIMLSKTGSGADEDLAGTIGNEILRQYKVTLDYGRGEVYLEKDPSFKDDREQTFTFSQPDSRKRERDGSLGLIRLTRRAGGTLEIQKLTSDGAAARARIKKGDLILAINGSPVGDLSMNELLGPFTGRAGTIVRLTIRNGDVTRDVTLTTE